MSDDRWLPAEKSTARWASGAHGAIGGLLYLVSGHLHCGWRAGVACYSGGRLPTDNPSGRTMALGSTQPLPEIRRLVLRPDNLSPSCADCLQILGP
jgi:hypothetical protein